MSYKRITTRLRFENPRPGASIPVVGNEWVATRELSGRPVLVKLLKQKKLWQHEDGAWLMDAVVSMRDLPQ